MKREILTSALVLTAMAHPAAAQDATPQFIMNSALSPASVTPPRGETGPARGFVYTGRLADGGGPLRWADYPIVSHVFSGSPAEAAGLRVGDSIMTVNGRDATETEAFFDAKVGGTWTLTVQRGLQVLEISYILVEPTWLLSEWTPPADSFWAP